MERPSRRGIERLSGDGAYAETDGQDKPTHTGFCIKTISSEGKVFINICHSPSIPPPADVTEDELLQMLEEDQTGFRIPMSLGEPHAELDASQCPRGTKGCALQVLPSPGIRTGFSVRSLEICSSFPQLILFLVAYL
jgi:hypothetical protein